MDNSNLINFKTGEPVNSPEDLAKYYRDQLMIHYTAVVLELGINVDSETFGPDLILVTMATEILVSRSLGLPNPLLEKGYSI